MKNLLAPLSDGYIRFQPPHLYDLSPQHLTTLLDDEARPFLHPDCAAGLTEWFIPSTERGQVITLGWDWYQCPETSTILFAEDDIRSNLMLISREGRDLGPNPTSRYLKAWLSQLNWVAEVRRFLLRAIDHPSK